MKRKQISFVLVTNSQEQLRNACRISHLVTSILYFDSLDQHCETSPYDFTSFDQCLKVEIHQQYLMEIKTRSPNQDLQGNKSTTRKTDSV